MTQKLTDTRVAVWFFSWLAGMFVFSGGFVLQIVLSPRFMRLFENNVWILVGSMAVALVCFVVALAPWYRGIHCRQCRRKLRRMRTDVEIATGNRPLRFYCETCNVVWETHLISGPGAPDSAQR